MRIWVNGRLLDDPTEPALSALDHGLTVGDGVFEAVKIVAGQPFALTRHLERMQRSAASLALPEPDLSLVLQGIEATLSQGAVPLGVLRITYTAGLAGLGSPRGDGPPTYVVAIAETAPYSPVTSIATVPWPRNERGLMAGVKSTSYAENAVALAHARAQGATEAIFGNLAGHVCEGTGSNIGYVVDGDILTPTLAAGCLAGVTRALLLEWANASGDKTLHIREADVPMDVLTRADEIFLMSTLRDVQGVERCDGRELNAPGPITQKLQQLWRVQEPGYLDVPRSDL